MTQKVRKDGFPVLAYSSLDDSAPMLSLLFRIKSPRRATLSLKSAYHGSGHDDALTFILQINPGDLVPEPGQNFLTPANLSLTQERLNAVQRQGNPNIRTLCLTLRQWCSIWYPKSMTTTPLRGVHPPLDELANLATASKLHLLFDMNWLGSEKKNVFEEFIHCPDRFTACPVEEHYSKEYAPLDWTLFDAPAYRDSTTDQEDPTPPYSVAIVKRARRTSTPSPPPSSLKRLLTSSDLGAIHTNTIEKDSAGTPHTKPEHSSRSSTAALSSSPYAATPRRDLRLLVDDILERSLMGRIGNLLPSLIEQLVTAPPPSPSQRSVASERSTTPSPLDLTPFGKTLGDYLMQRISAKFDALYEETLSHADFRRRVADDEFQDQLEEERLALNREAESTFHGLKQKCADLEEDVTERVERRVEELLELLEKHTGDLDSEGRASPAYGRTELRRKSAELSMREEDLRNERAAFRTERLAFLREKADFRKEKAELEKEKLHAQTAGEALYKGKDFSFPELPDCCVLP